MSVIAGKPNLVVTSSQNYWRPSEEPEAFHGRDALLEAKEALGDRVEIGGAVFQEPTKPKVMRLLGKLATAVVPALAGVGVLASGVATGGVVPAVLFGLAGVMTATQASSIKANAQDIIQNRQLKDNTGLWIWHSADKVVDLPLEDTASGDQGLTHMLADNMKSYPAALHVAHIGGHGHGANFVAGMSGKDAAEALDKGAEMGDNRIDVALVDACFGANFEQLSRYHSVDYVVAFEDQIPNSNSARGKIPMGQMLKEAADGSTGRDVAVEMAKVASEFFAAPDDDAIASVPLKQRMQRKHLKKLAKGTDSTAVAVDLKTMNQRLNPALDKAGAALLEALESDPKIGRVVRLARQENEVDNTRDLVDMGGFLTAVAKGTDDEKLQKSLLDADKALSESILTKRTGETYPLSGLSFHTRPNRKGSQFGIKGSGAHADNPNLPKAWVKFVDQAFASTTAEAAEVARFAVGQKA